MTPFLREFTLKITAAKLFSIHAAFLRAVLMIPSDFFKFLPDTLFSISFRFLVELVNNFCNGTLQLVLWTLQLLWGPEVEYMAS